MDIICEFSYVQINVVIWYLFMTINLYSHSFIFRTSHDYFVCFIAVIFIQKNSSAFELLGT